MLIGSYGKANKRLTVAPSILKHSFKMDTTKLLIVSLFLAFVNFSYQDEQPPIVNTSLGKIRGRYKESRHGRKYEAYEGIPYAQPPVKKLRFQPPQPVKPWEGELPAIKKSSVCTQNVMAFMSHNDKVKGCEDCLYINIYASIRNGSRTLLPVMFWIHGGAFQFASGNEADETLLMDRDIVFVAVNYRLGPFGFLSTGDSVVPGNMGLKDQSQALRWVHDHISNFGGDPQKITIFGMSAGGASVHYHYLSRLSAGLFQNGISISGVALSPWPQTKHAPEKARRLATLVGCSSNKVKKMINCLQSRPARIISQAVGDFMYWLYNPFTPFGPVVDKYGLNPFITRSPIDIILSGEAYDVPWISGVVSAEGLYTAAEFITKDNLLKQLNDYWDDIAPYLLDFYDTVPIDQQKQVAERIRSYYLGSRPINKNTIWEIIKLMGDRLFDVDFEKAVRLQANVNKSPVWTYYYSYRATHSVSEILSGGSTENFGVSHGDDIFLVLESFISNVTKPKDLNMQQLLVNFYTSFAAQGMPRVDHVAWPPLNPNDTNFRYLHIASPRNIKMESSTNFACKSFWNSIHFNENKIDL